MLVIAPPFTLQDYNQKCLQSLQNIPWGEGVAKPLPAGNQGSSAVLLMMQSMSSRSRSPCKKLKVCATQIEFIYLLSDFNCSYPFISDFYYLHNYPLINLTRNLRHILAYIFCHLYVVPVY